MSHPHSILRVAVATTCMLSSAAIATEPCATSITVEPSPDPADADVARLYDVTVIAPDDIWAVGLYRTCTDCEPFESVQTWSLAMHFDGDAWSRVATPAPLNPVGEANINLEDVDAVGPDLVYAAGSAAVSMILAPDSFVMRWNGSEWEHLDAPGKSAFGQQGYFLEAVHAIDAENIWFGGQFPSQFPGPTDPVAVAVHYDGSDFEVHRLPGDPEVIASHRIRAISSTGPDDVWAVGSAGGGGVAVGRTYVAHWDGSSWTHVPAPSPGFGEILRGVVALASDDVWISGRYQIVSPDGGSIISVPLFANWDGSDWTLHESPAFANDLVALAPDDIYGVGGSETVHWNGSEWTLVAEPLADPPGGFVNLLGIDAIDACSLVGVGLTSYGANDNTSLVVRIEGDADLPGDIDGDGSVGTPDLIALLSMWGPCEGCAADLDGDGTVGLADLLALLSHWG